MNNNKTEKSPTRNGVLEQFLDKSAAVGNENVLLTKKELQEKIKDKSFEYMYLPMFKQLVDVKAGEAGIDNAIVEVDLALAETGSVVIESKNENKRLATCLAEKLYVMIPLSRLVKQLEEVADFLEEHTQSEGGYVAFITGASRTADIERVLTVGVHGPKEMVAFIVTDL